MAEQRMRERGQNLFDFKHTDLYVTPEDPVYHNGFMIPMKHLKIIREMSEEKCNSYLKTCGECKLDGDYCTGLPCSKKSDKRHSQLSATERDKMKFEADFNFVRNAVEEIVKTQKLDHYPTYKNFTEANNIAAYNKSIRDYELKNRIKQELGLISLKERELANKRKTIQMFLNHYKKFRTKNGLEFRLEGTEIAAYSRLTGSEFYKFWKSKSNREKVITVYNEMGAK